MPSMISSPRPRFSRLRSLLALAVASRLAAGPEGGQVIVGDVTIGTNGPTTTVVAPNNSVLKWNSFDVGTGETVTFVQPGADARVLNWIGSLTPSQINGTLQANGQVYLINPAGVYFGKTAVVDVGGLYAAAGTFSKEDFLSGLNRFTSLTGDVKNAGSIHGDFVAMIGRSVENTGSIVAPGGFIGLAAGEQVLLGRNGSQVYVEATRTTAVPAGTTGVSNTGTLDAGSGSAVLAAGDLYAVAIAQDGKLAAHEARVQGQGSGLVRVNGTIDASASAADATGGRIEVTGEHVRLGATAKLDAAGPAGGGTVLVGGDFQGHDAAVRNATTTVVATGATLRADATAHGSGGRVIVWADGTTRFGGTLSARGGALGGDGGFAEVSGKGHLDFGGIVDLTAVIGRVGSLLLDPTNLTIRASNPDLNGDGTQTDDVTAAGVGAAGPGVDSFITAGVLGGLLNSASVSLAAGSTLTVASDVNWHTNTLTLTAPTVALNASLDATVGGPTGHLTITAGTAITQTSTELVRVGTLTLNGAGAVGTSADPLHTRAATLVLNKSSGGDIFINESTAIALEGSVKDSLRVVAGGNVTNSGALTVANGFTVDAGTNNIVLDDAGNNFATVIANGDAVTLVDAGALVLGTTTAASSLAVTVGGTLSQTGVVTVGTTTSLEATNAATDLNLGTQANDFTGAISFTGTVGNIRDLSLRNDHASATAATLALSSLTGLDTLVIDYANRPFALTGTIASTGAQTYNAAVTLSGNTTISAGANDVTFGSTVDGARTLTVNSTGTTTFTGAVGAVTGLTGLTTNAGGTTFLGGSVDSTGNVTFNDAVQLGADLTITTTNDTVAFGSTVDSEAGETNNLTVTTGSATTTFGGAIGSAVGGELGTLTVSNTSGSGVALPSVEAAALNVTTGGAITDSGTLTIAGAAAFDASATGDVTLNDAANSFGSVSVARANNVTLVTTAALPLGAFDLDGNLALTFGGALTQSSGTLTVDGTTTLTATNALTDIALGSAANTFTGALSFGGTLTNFRDFSLRNESGTAATPSFAGLSNLRNLSLNFPNNTISLNGAVSVGGTLSYLTSVSLGGATTLTAAGDVTFGSTVNGGSTLDVNTTGVTTFSGTVGGTTPLAGLTTDAGGSTRIGATISTSGAQTYNDNVRIDAAATLAATNSAIVFGGTLDSEANEANNLALFTGSALPSFGGAVGSAVNGRFGAFSLSTSNVAGIALPAITANSLSVTSTGGAITDAGTLTIAGTATFAAGAANNITLDSAANTFGTVVITSGNNVTFGDTGALALGASTITGNLDVSVGGALTQTGAVTVGTVPLPGTTTIRVTNAATDLLLGNTGNSFTGVFTVVNPGNVHDFTLYNLDANAFTTAPAQSLFTSLHTLTYTFPNSPIALTGTITSAGSLNYGGPVLVSGNAVLNATSINFGSTINGYLGSFSLDLNTSGATVFSGVVGGTTPLASLSTNAGGTTSIGANITTTGAQSFGDAVTLTANATLTSTGGGLIGFASTVNGAQALVVTTAGATNFGGAVGGSTALTSLTANGTGTTDLAGNVTTTGGQTYTDAVTLSGNATLTSTGGSGISFASTVNGAQTLTVNTTGTTTFGGAVGGATALTSVATNAGGTTSLAGNVTTTGTQNFGDAVTLVGSATLFSSGGGAITFSNTLDGAFTLAVNTAGTTTFTGAVGGTTALTSLTTNAGGTTSLGGNVTTTGAQTYNDAVTLAGNATLASTGGGNIGFVTTLNGARTLAVNTAGTTSFGGVVGGTTALTSLTTDATGATTLAGNVTTTGAQTYNDAVSLFGSATLASTGSGAITFNSTLNGLSAGLYTLAVNTGGATTFAGAIGATGSLAGVSTDAAGTTSLAGNVTTTGAQTFNDAVTLTGNATLASTSGGTVAFGSTVDGAQTLTVNTTGTTTFGGAVGGTTALTSLTTNTGGTTSLAGNVTTAGAQSYNDAVTLAGNATLASTGSGNIAFATTVDGARTLAVNTAGTTSFGGVVGGTTALTSLTTDAAGATTLAGNVTTTGAQSFGDAVTLGGNATLASTGAGNIGFGSTLNGAAALTVNTAGTSSFGGVVGGTTALTSVTTNAGGTTALAGNVTTTGAQNFGDAVTLTTPTTLASTGAGTIGFTGTLDGAVDLTVNTTGTTNFSGTVGGTTPLASVTTNAGGTTTIGANITTTGAMTFNDAVQFLAATTLASNSAGAIAFNSTVNGAAAVTVNTAGTTTFGSTVGATTALTSLTTDAAGTTRLAGNVTTTGAQTFNDAVVLTGNSAFTSTGAGNLTFGSTVNGAFALTANTAGTTNFGGVVGGTAALASLTTNAGGTTSLAGDVTTTGAQTYNDAVQLAADTTLRTTNSTLTLGGGLNSASAAFNNLTVLTGSGTITFGGGVGTGAGGSLGTLTITNTGGVALAATTANALNVSTTGSVTDSGVLTIAGAVNVSAPGANVVLDTAGNTFGTLTLDAGNITVVESGAMDLGTVNATGALTLTATGNLTGLSEVNVGGLTTLSAGGAIVLNNAANTFSGAIAFTGSPASLELVDDTPLDMAAVTVGGGSGSLRLTAPGLTQSGAILAGTTILNAGSSAITFANAGNVFGDLTITGGTVTLTDNSALTDGGAWNTGVTTLSSGLNALTLDVAGSTTGLLSLTGGAVSVNRTAALQLGAVNAGTLTLTSPGGINGTATILAGATTLNSGGAAISLTNAANVFGDLAVTGGTVTLTEDDDLTDGGAWTTGATTLNAGTHAIVLDNPANSLGDLTLAGASATIFENGPITDGGAWTVAGGTTLNAGTNAITLDALGSNTGALGLTGGTVSVTRTGAVTLGAVNATTLAVTSPGGISGTGVVTAGATNLNATTGTISLTNASNVIGDLTITGGAVAITENDVITDGGAWTTTGLTTLNAGGNAIVLNNPANVLGDLILTGSSASILENDAITDGGDWNVAGTTTLNAGANAITLDALGSSTGVMNLTGGAVSVSRTGPIQLGTITSTSLSIASPSGISSTTAIQTGAASFNAGTAAISLTNTANVFGDLTITGGAVTIVENDPITDGGAWTTTGLTSLNSGGNSIFLNNSSNVLGPLVLTGGATTIVENDAITQGGAWSTGATTLNAGGNAITLTTAGNVLGDLTFTGGAVQVAENDGINLAGASTATSLALTANGAITDAAGTSINVAGAATLNAGGNAITLGENAADTTNFGSLAVTGGAVNITEDSAMAIKGTATGSMTLRAAGVDLGGVTTPLLVVTSTGAITDSAATNVIGAAVFDAGGNDIILDESANDFSSVEITGATVVLNDANAVALAAVLAAGPFSAKAGTDLTVNTALVGSGNVSLTGTTGNVTLNSNVSSSGGTVTVLAGQNVVQNANLTANAAGGNIDVRATAGSITTGAGFGATTNGGSINYRAGTGATLGGFATNGGAVNVQVGGAAQFISALNVTGAFDVTAGAGGIEFLQTVNGTGATSDLTLRTAGATRFAAAVGATSGPDSITTDAGGTTVVAGGSLRVGGVLAIGDDFVAGADATVGAGSATFAGTVRGATDGGQALTLSVGGDTVFTGAVGPTGARLGSLTTTAGGRTLINGGSVNTTGAQTYGDSVVLGAATTFTGTALAFNGSVDSTTTTGTGTGAFAGPSDLTANISGATIFAGTVGQGSRLGAVTTDAAGTTAIRGNFTANTATFGDTVAFDGAAATKVETSGTQSFKGDVTLGTDLTLRSTTADVNLDKGATGAGRGITLEATAGTISIGGALGGSSARLREVAANGKNVAVADVWTTGNIALAMGRGLGTAGSTRNDYLQFTGTQLNSETGDIVLGSGATTADAADDKTTSPLRSSIFKSNDGDLFIVGRNVTIQPFERMSVRNGTLVLFADDTLTVSSTAAANTLALIGNHINLRARAGQDFEYGTTNTVVKDRGTDLVSGAVLFFQPTGLPGVPTRANLTTYDFSTSTGTIRTDNPGNVVQVVGTGTVFVADLRDNLLRPLTPGLAFLDLSTAPGLTEANLVTIPADKFGPLNDTPLIALVAQGAQVRNSLEQAFTPIVPREEVTVPESDPDVSDAVREQLQALGIYARKLRPAEAVARGRRAGLFVEVPERVRPRESDYQVVDARMEDRAVRAVIQDARAAGLIGDDHAGYERAAQALAAAFGRFEATGADAGDGGLFRGWLERAGDADANEVLGLVRSLEATIRQIELLGLTRQELEVSKSQIYGSILRNRLNADADFLRGLVEGAKAAPAVASVIAPYQPSRFAAVLPAATPIPRVP